MILLPPVPPITMATSPVLLFRTTEGDVEDMGLLPGSMKLEGDVGKPNALVVPGVAKLSI